MGAEKASRAEVLKTYALPGNAINGIGHNDQMLKAISSVYGEGLKDKLPLVLYCDQTGNVFMFSSGYKIGVGEQPEDNIYPANKSQRKYITVFMQ